jgi:hypothetical protein
MACVSSGSHGGEYEDDSLLRPDDRGSTHLWNVGIFLEDYMALFP